MSNAPDDLEDLFDQVAAQRTQDTPPALAPSPEVTTADEVATDAEAKPQSDNPMFDRLGGIVRQLHNSLKELGYDQTLAQRVGEIADSKGRLEHIANLTEQAANKVLNAVDAAMPEQDKIAASAKDIEGRWALMLKGKLPIDDFKTLAVDSKLFASNVLGVSELEKARLMDIMMAQDFQDITGQLIKKILAISQTLETDLAQLLRDYALNIQPKEKVLELMAGPDVSGNALVQGDVDNLLADLGF